MIKKIFLVAGTRPNFIKIAPLIKELSKRNLLFKIIHTGQHYDYNMSKVFFEGLGIPEPDIHLNIGSASQAVQIAKIMIEFEKVILKEKPLLVVVVGDVNSTLACSLVAKNLDIKVAHVEAGLRSFDQHMPEEINRILTDRLSNLLFTTEYSAESNLLREGIEKDKIFFVGNVMIDTLVLNLDKTNKLNTYKKYKLKEKEFALMTIHRPSNVDFKDNFKKIIKIINYLQERITIMFPIHPRSRKMLKEFNLEQDLINENLILSEPLGYLDFINLMLHSKMVLTDSGGIQEEASYLRIPVLTLRENTERPITIEQGTNELVGLDFEKIIKYVDDILSNHFKKGRNIEKWDGKTAERIVDIIQQKFF